MDEARLIGLGENPPNPVLWEAGGNVCYKWTWGEAYDRYAESVGYNPYNHRGSKTYGHDR